MYEFLGDLGLEMVSHVGGARNDSCMSMISSAFMSCIKSIGSQILPTRGLCGKSCKNLDMIVTYCLVSFMCWFSCGCLLEGIGRKCMVSASQKATLRLALKNFLTSTGHGHTVWWCGGPYAPANPVNDAKLPPSPKLRWHEYGAARAPILSF